MMSESHPMRALVLALVLLAFMPQPQSLLARGDPSVNSALGSVGTVWGGDHLELEVTADGAGLNFDCATGTINGALVPDAQGKFTIDGTLVRERPGPTMRGGNPAAQAKYSGTIHGATLHLIVTVEGSSEPYGEYVLTRGKPGRVVKCR
jgi:hypothetical protein